MAIKYYPNRVFRALPTPVDALMKKDTVRSFKNVQDITVTAIDETLSPFRDWQVTGIKLSFSNLVARDYSVKIASGRSIIENLNDFLWIQNTSSLPQKITLDTGFYTGTELATELQTQLDANTAFTALGITFTVAYDVATGNYTITPSSGSIRYLDLNTGGTLPNMYSICGYLFGFNEDTAFLAAITSDTAVPGLDSETYIIDETASVVETHYNSDPHILSLDEAIRVETSAAALTVNYSIDYKYLDL